MTNDRPLGVGVIGLGMAVTPHAKSLKDLSNRATVRGIFARNPDRRAETAEQFGFPAADSVDAIIDDPDISVVLLLTPPNARGDLVARLAAAGKHILMEKPVERTTAAGEAIVETCEKNGVKLGIVFQHRFRPITLKLKALVESGELGEIACVRVSVPWWRPQEGYYDQPGRGSLERDGGGLLISQAIHPLDLMLSLTGPVADVQAIAGTSIIHQMETEDFVGGGMRFANGALGSFSGTTAAYPGAGEQIALDCVNGNVVLEAGELTVNWRDGRKETFTEDSGFGGGADPMAFPHDWHLALLTDFLDAIEADRSPTPSGREGLNVHRLIDAFLASSRERRAVEVAGA